MANFATAHVDLMSVGKPSDDPAIYSLYFDSDNLDDSALTIDDEAELFNRYSIVGGDVIFLGYKGGPTCVVSVTQYASGTRTMFFYPFSQLFNIALPFYNPNQQPFDVKKLGALNKLSSSISAIAIYTLTTSQRVDEVFNQPLFHNYLKTYGVKSGDIVFLCGTTTEDSDGVAGAPYTIPIAVYDTTDTSVIRPSNNINRSAFAFMIRFGTSGNVTFRDSAKSVLVQPSVGDGRCPIYSYSVEATSTSFKSQTRMEFVNSMRDLGGHADFGTVFFTHFTIAGLSATNTFIMSASPSETSNDSLSFFNIPGITTQPRALLATDPRL